MAFGLNPPASFEGKLLVFAFLAFIAVQLFFIPEMYASIDEHSYLKNAFLLREGRIGISDPAYACRSNILTQQGYVSSQFPGRSFFLIPFTYFGFDAVMLSGLLIHLLNFALLALIFGRLSLNRLCALLYLFFPTFIWSARTLNAELLVLTGLLGAFYFYLGSKKQDWALSGLFFAIAAFVRYDAALAFAAFLIPAFLENKGKFAGMLAGFLPAALLIGAFNMWAYSGALNTGYGSGQGLASALSAGLLDKDLVIYAAILLLFYPLMLASPFLSKKFRMKKEFSLLIALYFVLNAAFTEFLAFQFSIESTFTARLRYLIPLIGLLIVPYAVFIDGLSKKYGFRVTKQMLIAGVLLLLAGSAFLSYKHSAFLDTRESMLRAINSNVPEGSTVIGSSDDCIYFQKSLFGDRKYFNVRPAKDLAGNPKNISISGIAKPGVYVIEVNYGYLAERESPRQDLTDSERKLMRDFIESHKGSLDLVFESTSPDTLRIYRFR